MKRIILITGGARSGKSTYAEKLALELSPTPVHPALHVRELSLQFVLGSCSHTYFIGYKDEGCVLCREAVELCLYCGKCPVGI